MIKFTRMAVVALAAVAGLANAEFPERPISIIVGSGAGGPLDTTARITATALASALGGTVLIDNVPGAGGNIAARKAAEAKKDGHTLLLMSTLITINPALYKQVHYDPVKSFEPIGMLGTGALMLFASPSSGIKTVADVIARAKANPGQVSYASGGNGTTSHLLMENFRSLQSLDMVHVPYKGMPPALVDLAGDRVALAFAPIVGADALVRAGRIVPIAVASDKRSSAFPEVPTFEEGSVPGMNLKGWSGLAAPAGISAETSRKLAAALDVAMKDQAMLDGLRKAGFDPEPMGAAAFGRLIARETQAWTRIVKESRATVD